MDSLSESVNALKSIYGDRCMLLKEQGDYKWLMKVKLKNKIMVYVALPNAENATKLEIFTSGCTDKKFQAELEEKLKSVTGDTPIDGIFKIAELFIDEHTAEETVDDPRATKKVKKAKKEKTQEESPDQLSRQSMKTASDVISRIRWDHRLLSISEHFVVGYLDRFVGLVEKPFSDFNWTDDFVDVDMITDFSIPQHRVQYFKYKTAIVWDKRERFDAIFNSAGCEASLDKIISDEDAKQ